ncbi:short chain dehydrogenase [Truncatella angustata]|uniref:Short chain dehydrogenase n=1 Tax=Truncatella angustata TaxID=152316 RepID=A0A9P8RIX8_9PEZI|nr:short chain dehydrogenase [Truncatella angustata]KAH6646694.1 short chain dehydrogenase [Truncatella angustata]
MSSSIDLAPFQGSYFNQFLHSQFRTKAPSMTTDVSGQTGIIIGGNGGVAFEAARILLAHKISRLILTVRNPAKFEKDVAPLRKAHASSRIEVWPLDLLSYDSIRAFAQRCETLDSIHFVNISAGAIIGKFEINKPTGHETNFQVNYLSAVYLAMLLLPILKGRHPAGRPSHLTMVSSGLIYVGAFNEQKFERLFAAFDDPKNFAFPGSDRYTTAKMMLLMFLVRVKDCVSPDEVVVNVVDPGFMRNGGLDRNVHWALRPLGSAFRAAAGRSTREGAMTYIDASVLKGKESHGSFLYNWTVAPFCRMMYTAEGRKLTDRVWDETLQEFEFAGVRQILASMQGKSL